MSKGFTPHHFYSKITNMFFVIKSKHKRKHNFRLFGKSGAGFTLVEMVVVMAVFLFIIGVAATVFISIMEGQGNILQEQKILNQISYVEEHMSKALRMAKRATNADCIPENYIYQLTREDTAETGFYSGIKFINQSDSDACTEFFLDSTDGVLKEIKNGGTAIALTSESTTINYVRFGINGYNGCKGAPGLCTDGAYKDLVQANLIQPRLTILLDIQVKGNTQNPSRIFQTTISQRNLNGQ